jgi:N-acetylglucosaminyldiphosphoundecaprenol N-acetyl-beta-D-mannosaminyltransferase
MKILDVKVDNINQAKALEVIQGWLSKPGKHYITTPNLEFIQLAQKDLEFKEILNRADLAVPDSSRLGWLYDLKSQKKLLKKLLIFPLGIFPKITNLTQFDIVAGVDLMESLCELSSEKGFTVGFLGGVPGVAEKTKECLQKKFAGLKVELAEEGPARHLFFDDFAIPKLDILFVALGAPKQEKWIYKNLDKIPVKVAMGVGGAFDYLSGNVPRAPIWLRSLGLEWLFRLIIQPWRIKRQLKLVIFLLNTLY